MRSVLFLIFAGIVSIITRPALADPQQLSGGTSGAAQSSYDLEEVTVTARRRSESAQTIPVAVTAMSAAQLEERHITTPQDLQGQVPSLSVSPYGQGRDVEMFVVRGQSTQYGAASAVVQYLAEIPLVPGSITSLQGSPGQLFDLANVQVLRGPQGTLFGRNTTGGAILLEPARPTNKYSGSLRVQFGNYSDKEIEAVVNVPVNDRLQLRFAGTFVDRGGYTRDIVSGVDYDNRHYFAGRLGVTWKPTDSVENYLMFSGSKSHTHGSGWVLSAFNIPYADGVFGANGGCAGVGFGANCSVLSDLVAAQRARGPRQIALGPQPPPLESRIEGWNLVDQLKIDLSNTVALRNILSYGALNSVSPYDGDGTPLAWANENLPLFGYTDQVRQLTEELQVQGNARSNHLTYTAGVYYEAVNTPANVTFQGINFFFDSGTSYHYDNTARAAYAQIGYDLGDATESLAGLKLTAGARYTWDRVHASGSGFSLGPNNTVTGCSNGVPVIPTNYNDCANIASQSSSAPSWTLGLDYMVAGHVLVYGKATRGYKRGGFNLFAVSPSNLTFAPEHVTTYELGFKSTFRSGDGPFTFNANVFHSDYKDIQVVAGDYNANTFASGAAVFNAAAATIKGVEVEASVTPGHGLELSANYSHLRGEYKQFSVFSAFGQFDCSGGFVVGTADLRCMPFSYLPKEQFSVTARYSLQISSDIGKVVFGATYAYTGSQIEATTNLPQYESGSYFAPFGLVNASLTWSDILKTPVEIGLFVANASNKTYRISNTGVFNTLGIASDLWGEPRMYGLRLRYHW